jgi:hypothetical protein
MRETGAEVIIERDSYMASKDCIMSLNMSSESSIPQLNRTRLSLMPSFALSSGV